MEHRSLEQFEFALQDTVEAGESPHDGSSWKPCETCKKINPICSTRQAQLEDDPLGDTNSLFATVAFSPFAVAANL